MNANQMLLVTSVMYVNQASSIIHLVKKVCQNVFFFVLKIQLLFTVQPNIQFGSVCQSNQGLVQVWFGGVVKLGFYHMQGLHAKFQPPSFETEAVVR